MLKYLVYALTAALILWSLWYLGRRIARRARGKCSCGCGGCPGCGKERECRSRKKP
mgnify:CR=1 FL=1